MKKLLIIVAAGLAMAACSDTPTAPSGPKASGSNRANADFECRSGYAVAYDEYGNPYCVPIGDGAAFASPAGTSSPPAAPKP